MKETGKGSRVNIVMVVLIVLFAGLSGHLLRGNLQKAGRIADLKADLADARVEEPSAPPAETRVAMESDAADAALGQLNAELVEARREAAELRRVIGEKDQEIAQLAEQSQRRPQDRGRGRETENRERRSPAEFMERLRRENPERFEQIRTRIQEMNARRAEGIEAQNRLFETVDVKTLQEEELENHNLLVAKLARIEELNGLIQDPEFEEQRGELYRELREEFQGTRELLEAERKILLKQFPVDLGYEPEEAGEFSDYIDQIYDTTSSRSLFGWGGRSRRNRSDAEQSGQDQPPP
jgi:hypothetical protein